VLLDLHWCSMAWICAPQFHSALLHRNQHSPCRPSTPHQALLLSLRRTSFPPKLIILPLKLHCSSLWANLNSNRLDITNRAKRHCNWTLPTCQAWIIQKYMERLQLLCAIDQMCVPVFVGPDEMGDVVDYIETMFDWYHSDPSVGLLFWFYLLSLFTHSLFSLVLPSCSNAWNWMLMRCWVR
jgi:hypothetical protein